MGDLGKIWRRFVKGDEVATVGGNVDASVETSVAADSILLIGLTLTALVLVYFVAKSLSK